MFLLFFFFSFHEHFFVTSILPEICVRAAACVGVQVVYFFHGTYAITSVFAFLAPSSAVIKKKRNLNIFLPSTPPTLTLTH